MRESTKRRDERIRELRRQGMKRTDIAEEMLCSASVVNRALKELEDPGRTKFEDHENEIIRMYQEGIAVQEIVGKTGVSASTINRRMRELGIGRGRGWTKGTKRSTPRRWQMHRETGGEAPVSAVSAQAGHRRAKRITIRGKNYLDVSDWYM